MKFIQQIQQIITSLLPKKKIAIETTWEERCEKWRHEKDIDQLIEDLERVETENEYYRRRDRERNPQQPHFDYWEALSKIRKESNNMKDWHHMSH